MTDDAPEPKAVTWLDWAIRWNDLETDLSEEDFDTRQHWLLNNNEKAKVLADDLERLESEIESLQGEYDTYKDELHDLIYETVLPVQATVPELQGCTPERIKEILRLLQASA